LATATPDGRPSVRMVLLKSADARGFTFFSGYTSRKGRELEANPRAALLFHRPDIQVRVEGPVERVPAAESDAYWATRPAASRRRRLAAIAADRESRGARGGGPRAAGRAAAAGALGRLPARPRHVRVLAAPRRPPA